MSVDYRADKSKPIRNGDTVVSEGFNNFRVYERPEVIPLPSAASLAWAESLADRFDTAPSGWNLSY